MHNPWLVVATLITAGLLGCSEPQVRGRVIEVVVNGDERWMALGLTFETRLEEADRLPDARSQLRRDMQDVVAHGSPYLVANFMMRVHGGLRASRVELVTPLTAACLESKDPLVRWSGIWSLSQLEAEAGEAAGDRSPAQQALQQNYHTLLIRPDVKPWWTTAWWKDENSEFNRLNAAGTLALMRARLIERVGQYRITEGRPVLLAVKHDRWDWNRYAREAAEKALAELEQTPEESQAAK